MLLSGDEIGFTKWGNNNTYCHDNRLNWLDWSLLEKNRDLWAFTRFLISLRHSHPGLRRGSFFQGSDDIRWASPEGGPPDWSSESRSLAVWISGKRKNTGSDSDAANLWVALHFHWEPKAFRLPSPSSGNRWVTLVDTTTEAGFFEPSQAPSTGPEITLGPRSLVLAWEKPSIHD